MERTGSQEDLIFGITGPGRWSDWRSWSRRQKLFVGISIIFSMTVLTTVIGFIVAYGSSSSGPPAPPTVAPTTTTTIPTTTTITTPTTTTSTTTTSTTTTPTTTTTATTTTTSTTTTPPTTTSNTTTPPTTTKPTTTTSPTTTKSTTTLPTTTTEPPHYNPVTVRPPPHDPYNISAYNLLNQVGLKVSYVNETCDSHKPDTWKEGVFIENVTTEHANHTWWAESDTVKHARTLAARQAVGDLFGFKDYKPISPTPAPVPPCHK